MPFPCHHCSAVEDHTAVIEAFLKIHRVFVTEGNGLSSPGWAVLRRLCCASSPFSIRGEEHCPFLFVSSPNHGTCPSPAYFPASSCSDMISQDSPVTNPGFCPECSLAIVIYYNSLQCLLRDLSFRRHYQVIRRLVQVQTGHHSQHHPFVPIFIDFAHITPEGDTKERKVLKNPQKHEIKMEVSPFFKHSFKSCKSILKGVLTDGPSEKVKLKWFQKGLCHFLLAISQANCRPAVTLEPRSSSHVIGACISIFL